MEERRWKLITISLIIVLSLNLYAGRKRFQYLEEQIRLINNQMANMEHKLINSINKVNSEINTSLNDLVNYDFAYKNINVNDETVTLIMTFELKQILPNAGYYIVYKAIDDGNSEKSNFLEVRAETAGGTSYTCEMTLSLEYNYQFQIIEKSDDGGIRQLNHDYITNHINDMYLYRVMLHSSSGSENGNYITYGFVINNRTFGESSLEIDKVEVLALSTNNTLLHREDITANNDLDELIKNTPIDSNYSSNSSASFGSSTNRSRILSHFMRDKDFQEQSYYVLISKEDLRENHPDIFKKKKDCLRLINWKLIITLKNGDQIEL